MKKRKINTKTAITIFVVIKPLDELEMVGEELILTFFGEYCPERSMRGYSLFHLVTHPQNYCIKTIMQQGKIYQIEPPISPATVTENNHL